MRALGDVHEPLGIAIRQRLDERGIDERRRSPRSRPCQSAIMRTAVTVKPDSCEAAAPRIGDPGEVVEEVHARAVAALLLALLDAANCTMRAPAGFVGMHAGMRCRLRSVAPGGSAALRRAPVHLPRVERANEGEGAECSSRRMAGSCYQTVRTMSVIAAASRSHCAASWSSAFRPALVSV